MREIDFSLHDIPVSAFFYSIENRKIDVTFYGYYDLKTEEDKEIKCHLVISNWSAAKAKDSMETRYRDLDYYIGIFSLVLDLEVDEKILKLLFKL